MAKTNQVTLYGALVNLPRVNGERTKASVTIMVMRGDRESGDPNKQVRKDYPIIASKDPDIIEQMGSWDINDLVLIKGVLVTKVAKKSTICPHCKKENLDKGSIVYIEPIYVEKMGHADTVEDANRIVYEHREISNSLRIVGDLCINPSKVELKRISVSQYQIAVPRTYRVKGSTDDDKTDFPFVKSYGKNAKEDLKRLRKGSVVLIDGYIQTRKQDRETECKQILANGEPCGTKYTWTDSSMEIVPFETEYLRNYITDEELGVSKNFIKDQPN